MNYKVARIILMVSILMGRELFALSMVWNFRIAQITKQPIATEADKNHTIVALFFDQYRKRYDGVRQNYGGGLGSFIYNFNSHYFRTDFAVSHIHEKNTKGITTFSGTQTDDILFTLGRTLIKTEHNTTTLSGLLGVPTHKILRLQHPEFGYAQVGLGIQGDGSYILSPNTALLYGARYLYFIPRNADDCSHHVYKLTQGDIADLLLAYKKNWGKHGIELGYTSRFRFGADICPSLDEMVEKTNYLRSNIYAVYKYKFLVGELPNRLLLYTAYGRDHKPKIFGSKYILTVWGSWNISF